MNITVDNARKVQANVASPSGIATRPVADVAAPSSEKKAAPSTTVTLSSAALALQAASLEARETPAQTAKEAQHNDPQARRLLAKEQAAKA